MAGGEHHAEVCRVMMLFAMANCGLPATSGFRRRVHGDHGAMRFNFWIALVAGTTLVFGAAYTLWMYKRVIFGEVANRHVAELKDANCARAARARPVAAAVLWMGVYPRRSPRSCTPR